MRAGLVILFLPAVGAFVPMAHLPKCTAGGTCVGSTLRAPARSSGIIIRDSTRLRRSAVEQISASESDAPPVMEPPAVDSVSASAKPSRPSFLKVLWRFTRPHTFIGTALCIPALHIFAAPPGAELLNIRVLYSILWALLPAGLINVYITGLNQVTDVEIDKINKPYLPIAAGDLSKGMASFIVVLSLALGLGLGFLPMAFASPALTLVLVSSVILGTVYSLPPFRLKRFPVLAALCIIAVRGSLVNVGFYGHALTAAFGAQDVSVLSLAKDIKCMLATAFFAVFGAVIAFMKDVPDVEGDAVNDIRSFSVRAGAKRMFKIGTVLTTALFAAAAGGCLFAARPSIAQATWRTVSRSALAACCAVAASKVRTKAATVDPDDGKQVYSYYMYLWKLFYCSYLALPLAR